MGVSLIPSLVFGSPSTSGVTVGMGVGVGGGTSCVGADVGVGGSSVAAGLPQAAATRKPRARRKTGICNSLLLIMGWGYYSPVGGGDGFTAWRTFGHPTKE